MANDHINDAIGVAIGGKASAGVKSELAPSGFIRQRNSRDVNVERAADT